MIRQAIATRFDRQAESGRSKPLRVVVETSDGIEHEAILKLSARLELGIENLANEALAAMLASDLGLPVTEPFIVEILDDWIASIPDIAVRTSVENSCRKSFASRHAGAQWRPWTLSDRVLVDRKPSALAILAFDAFVQNDDRKVSNPNLLVLGENFRIIDHELAFSTRLRLFPPAAPWELGNLQRLSHPDGHALYSELRGSQLADFAAVRDAWVTLSDERINSYIDALPAEWNSAKPAQEEAIAFLKEVRDKVDACIDELVRVLQ